MLAALNVAATCRSPELARLAWRLLIRSTASAPVRWRNNPPPGRVQVLYHAMPDLSLRPCPSGLTSMPLMLPATSASCCSCQMVGCCWVAHYVGERVACRLQMTASDLQEISRREAQELERLERVAMGGTLLTSETAAEAAQAGGGAESPTEPAAAFGQHSSAAGVQGIAAAELATEQKPAREHMLAAEAAAEGERQSRGASGVPGVTCFHAFIHAHAAAGDLRSDPSAVPAAAPSHSAIKKPYLPTVGRHVLASTTTTSCAAQWSC